LTRSWHAFAVMTVALAESETDSWTVAVVAAARSADIVPRRSCVAVEEHMQSGYGLHAVHLADPGCVLAAVHGSE